MSSNSTNDAYPPSYSSFSGKVLLKAVIVIMIITFLYVLLHLCSRYFFGRHIVTADHIRNMNSVQRSNRPHQRSGLHPSVISSLPVFSYHNTINKQDVDDGVVECTVCLGQLEEGEKVKMLPRCKHVFHIDCIDMWLYSHSSCPVCRANAEPPDESDRSIGSTDMIIKELDTSNMKDVGSTSSFRNSFRRILSMDGSGGRRTQESGEMVEDLERQ